jgi:hypothetical protein
MVLITSLALSNPTFFVISMLRRATVKRIVVHIRASANGAQFVVFVVFVVIPCMFYIRHL